jgi:hypothetical protein
MRTLHLGGLHDSLYFWPGVILSAIAIFFLGWAVLISSQDWVGQAIWGALAAMIASACLVKAARESRRTLRPAA